MGLIWILMSLLLKFEKFDGRKTRRLNLIEMSQIAEAGRFKNDGGFGTTGD